MYTEPDRTMPEGFVIPDDLREAIENEAKARFRTFELQLRCLVKLGFEMQGMNDAVKERYLREIGSPVQCEKARSVAYEHDCLSSVLHECATLIELIEASTRDGEQSHEEAIRAAAKECGRMIEQARDHAKILFKHVRKERTA